MFGLGFVVSIVLPWLKGFTLRQWIEAAGAVAIVVFVLWWDHREIQKGRDECAAAQIAAQAEAEKQATKLQAKIDMQAKDDKKLQDALSAARGLVPSVRFNPACKLTPAQVAELSKALQ